MGEFSVFCLYKTLPIPNGGVLVQNDSKGELTSVELDVSSRVSVAARSLELMLQWLRIRHEFCGRTLMAAKRRLGNMLSAARVERVPVGNTGFDVSAANIGMSALSRSLLRRFDYEAIRKIRRRNFQFLYDALLDGARSCLRELTPEVCPLFFPLLVKDKQQAARALWKEGIETVEFWNCGDPAAERTGSDAQFLRRHVLEVPIHQDVTPEHLDHVAQQVKGLRLAA